MAESKDDPLTTRPPSKAQTLAAIPITELTPLEQVTEYTKELTAANKDPTTFLDLPAELRNRIYDLSGCLKLHQCRKCNLTVFGDHENIKHEDRSETRQLYNCTFLDLWCRKSFRRRYRCGHAARETLIWVNRKPYDGATTHHQSRVINGVSLESTVKSTESLAEADSCRCEVEEINEASVPRDRRSKMHPERIARKRRANMKGGTNSVWDNDRAQPSRLSIAQVCKDLRKEVLSIYYASTRSYATLFDTDIDGAAILQWLNRIGPVNAAHLSSFYIVYS